MINWYRDVITDYNQTDIGILLFPDLKNKPGSVQAIMSKIINGQRKTSYEEYKKIYEILGVPEWLNEDLKNYRS